VALTGKEVLWTVFHFKSENGIERNPKTVQTGAKANNFHEQQILFSRDSYSYYLLLVLKVRQPRTYCLASKFGEVRHQDEVLAGNRIFLLPRHRRNIALIWIAVVRTGNRKGRCQDQGRTL
jgi:hypothetical protein